MVSDIKNEKEERSVPVKIIPYVEVRTEDDASKFLNKIISKFSKTGWDDSGLGMGRDRASRKTRAPIFQVLVNLVCISVSEIQYMMQAYRTYAIGMMKTTKKVALC